MSAITGTIAAAFTPRGKNGDVDFGAFFELLDFLGRARVAGVALFTAAGEYPAIPISERIRFTCLAVKRNRVPTLVDVGSATLDDSLLLAREARDAGAAALLLSPPYFYPLDADDVAEFYTQFSHRLGPGPDVLLLDTPLTPAISRKTASDLIASGGFAGLCASGAPAGVPWLSMDDARFSESRRAGAAGAISEIACIVPELMLALERSLCAGDGARAEALDREVQTLAVWLAGFPQPAGLKAAAGWRQLKPGPETAAPLTLAKRARMDAFREWFPGWLDAIQKTVARA